MFAQVFAYFKVLVMRLLISTLVQS